MKRFWSRGEDELGRELRANRPEPSDAFVHSLAKRIRQDGPKTRMYALSRLSFAAAITVFLLGTLVSFGGFGYAASGTRDAVKAVKNAVAPTNPKIVKNSAAQDQYKPQKVTICHKGHTITVSQSALPAHLRHGDTVGPCPGGGVAGANAGHNAGNGVLGQAAAGQTLPFTGISLAVTVLISLLLLGTGLALRRAAGRRI